MDHQAKKWVIKKNKVCFSQNVNHNVASQISAKLGVSIITNLGLEFPLLYQRVSPNTYASLVNKVNKKFSSQKADSLTLVGKLTPS